MKEHQLLLNLAKTELLVFPASPNLQHDFMIQLGSSTITPSASVRNLGVIFDDKMTSKEHIAKTARSCRFAQHNIRKIRPFLTEHAAQLLVQALVISRLDYCYAQNHSPKHSRSPFLAGGMNFPSLSGTLNPCQSSSDT